MKKLLTILLALCLLCSFALAEAAEVPENTVVGDASAEDAFVVWGWNTDVLDLLNGLYGESDPELLERITFVNTGGSDYYQSKIDPILEDPTNELYPDLIALEVDYVQKYVNSGYLLSTEDLGIAPEEYAGQYEYNLQLGSDFDGYVRALFWQATPGSWQIRADFAEKYLGTTDPELIQEALATWENVLGTAATVNMLSEGKVKLLSGYSDLYRVFSNSRTKAWYDENDVIQIDDNMIAYMELAKAMYTDELSYNTTQWSTEWYANMSGDGVETGAALAYTGCPWFTYWCLSDSWKENTILAAGPQEFYWGGTGLAATVGCADTELATVIMRDFTCNADFMKRINAQNSDFVNNLTANQEIIDAGLDACPFVYGDQPFIGFYIDKAETIDASTVTAEDQKIMDLFQAATDSYANGSVDLDTALANFKASVHDLYSYLKVA